jgi:hypothetical protein
MRQLENIDHRRKHFFRGLPNLAVADVVSAIAIAA